MIGVMERKGKFLFINRDNFGVFTQDTLTDLYRQITGLVFGLWPALKAARLDPIAALRHE